MARKTWTWLSGRKRPPGEYEELSTGTQWYQPALVRTVIGNWDPDSTALRADWAGFRDPAGQYYRNYVTGQDVVERQLDSVLAVAKEADFVTGLDPGWREALTTLVGAMSFAQWGVAMAHQHVQRFSLASTLAQCAQLQVMDKLRNAERDLEWYDMFAPDAAEDAVREVWTGAAHLQPLRRYVEEFLVVQDWGEVIVAVNVALLGLFEPFLREVYVKGGRAHGDFVTAALGSTFAKDAKRQVAWIDAFATFSLAEEGNDKHLADWLDQYLPRASAALDAVVAAYPLNGISATAAGTARAELRARLAGLGIDATDTTAAVLGAAPDSSAA